MYRTKILSYAIIFLIMAVVIACGTSPTPPPKQATATLSEESTSESAEPGSTKQSTFRFSHTLAWGGKDSLDPASPTRLTEVTVLLYNRLVGYGEHGLPVPRLAISWQPNETATMWTFKLREAVTFHDGKLFTANDVIYTFNHILDPDVESPMASAFGVIEKMSAPDDHTVIFHLTQPFADFPTLLMSDQASIIPDGSADTIGETGIGTGPFKLESLDIEGTTIFVANDNYWDGSPKLARIELIAIIDEDEQIQRLLDGDIDFLGTLPFQYFATFQNNETFVLQEFPTGNWRGFVMRTDTPPFDNVYLRKALRVAADRQAIIDEVLHGYGVVACDQPVWIGDPYHTEIDCPQDIVLAKQLLTKAGYPDGITLPLYVSEADPELIPMAKIYKEQVAQAGITIEVYEVPTDAYWIETWMVEPYVGTHWWQRSADLILNLGWRSDSSWNETYWNRPDFDALLDKARQEIDFEKRKALYGQIQRMLYEEGGAFIPFHMNIIRVFRNNVSGFQPVSDFYIDWAKVEKH